MKLLLFLVFYIGLYSCAMSQEVYELFIRKELTQVEFPEVVLESRGTLYSHSTTLNNVFTMSSNHRFIFLRAKGTPEKETIFVLTNRGNSYTIRLYPTAEVLLTINDLLQLKNRGIDTKILKGISEKPMSQLAMQTHLEKIGFNAYETDQITELAKVSFPYKEKYFISNQDLKEPQKSKEAESKISTQRSLMVMKNLLQNKMPKEAKKVEIDSNTIEFISGIDAEFEVLALYDLGESLWVLFASVKNLGHPRLFSESEITLSGLEYSHLFPRFLEENQKGVFKAVIEKKGRLKTSNLLLGESYREGF